MKIVYMGTPDFAVLPLEYLVKAGHEVMAVVTQPDKPKGRGKAMQPTPVKESALALKLPVYQPVDVNKEEILELLNQLQPEIIIVAAFGQLLKEEILHLPKYGCVNIHASLLPKLRGAAPIQWAILNGDKEAGVTIMQMSKGLDSGDMLLKDSVILEEKETGGSLHDRLSVLGADLIIKALKEIEEGKITALEQPEDFTYAAMLDKHMGEIDWTKDAVIIEREIRALNPWPSAYTYYEGKMLKIWEADIVFDVQDTPSTVVEVAKKSFTVATGNGGLKIKNLQLQGKKRMDTDAFLRGVNFVSGMQLGGK